MDKLQSFIQCSLLGGWRLCSFFLIPGLVISTHISSVSVPGSKIHDPMCSLLVVVIEMKLMLFEPLVVLEEECSLRHAFQLPKCPLVTSREDTEMVQPLSG